ncbi:MAG: DUF4335 domain-containing protein, partial [Moorea sp. SIO2B7]|nr:DUF4335 domain-containing protein [Moorena sp. SIO2B7]
MLLSNSVIRRYTPPTCTLEVKAKSSPLSRWTNRPLLKELRFKLRFDDPRLPEEEQVAIEGDRTQLEFLCDLVGNYVQDFLQQPSANLPLTPGISVLSFPATDEAEKAENLVPETATTLQSWTKKKDREKRKLMAALPSTPYLTKKGLVSHELFFGSLATESSRAGIKLSALQLFDLATALDEYSTDVSALPNLNPSKSRKTTPVWASAAGIVLAVGLTTVGVRAFNQWNTKANYSAALKESESLPTPQPIAVLPPIPPAPTSEPPPPPTLAPPLKSLEKLPPPRSVTSPNPPSRNIPPSPTKTTSLPAPPSPLLAQRQMVAVTPNIPPSSPPNIPPSSPPNIPLSSPPNIPLSSPPNIPLSSPPNISLSSPPNIPPSSPNLPPPP